MKEKITQEIVIKALDWAYNQVIDGIPGLGSAQDMAQNYLSGEGTLKDKANRLIRFQNAKSATSGFVTGFGGFITLPVTIPANLASVLYVQIRMIASIAVMGGYDLKSDQVQTLVYQCLVANSISEIVKNFGVKFGEKLAVSSIKKISVETIKKINDAVGFKLLTKFGQKGLVNLGKSVPFIGAIVGAVFDGVTTNHIGNIARKIFIDEPIALEA